MRGSVGKEDMATELAGDIAFYTSRRLNLSFIDSQWIMISAIAAGFAGTFGTPIAATIFAMEVVNRGKMRLDGLYPAFITALVTKEVTEYLGVHHLSFKISFPEMTLSVFFISGLIKYFLWHGGAPVFMADPYCAPLWDEMAENKSECVICDRSDCFSAFDWHKNDRILRIKYADATTGI